MAERKPRKHPQRIELRVPASTSNLGPGFDVIGLALGLFSEFLFERIDTEREILVEGEDAEVLRREPQNHTEQAFRAACQALNFTIPGLRIVHHNAIPVARGLGGSATAALAGTTAALLFSGLEPQTSQVLDQAFTIERHPDNITPSLVGGLTISKVESGQVLYVRLIPPPSLTTVILIPNCRVDTKAARRVIPQQFHREDVIFNISGAAMTLASLATGQLDHLAVAMRDRLHQPYRTSLIPGMMEIFEAALDAGSPGAALSGAGSGIFAFAYPDNEKAIGEAMKATGARFGMDSYTLNLPVDNVGLQIVDVS